MHTLIARDGDKWTVHTREHETVSWSLAHRGNVLRTAVDASFAFDPLQHNWTFSERQAFEVMADLLDAPEQTLGVAELRNYLSICVDRSIDITIYAPEGRFTDNPGDRWAMMQRSPRDRLWCGGLNSVFRPQSLRHQIVAGFFGFDQSDESTWKSLVGGKHGISRATHLRELWVRPAFRARALCPGDFPVFKPGFPHPTPRPLRTEAV